MRHLPCTPDGEAAPEETARQLRAGLDSLGDTLRTAEALVSSHRRIDLDGLDRQVRALCARVTDLPAVHSAPLRPSLHALVARTYALLGALATASPAATS